MALPHLLRIRDLAVDDMMTLFANANTFRTGSAIGSRHQGRIIASLFYEPSTRTRLSFASATLRLGAQVIGFESPETASIAKGESLVDTIQVVQRYCDAIILRHPQDGAATLAAAVAMVPIINAGDGGHEHPTQTLYDLYTIYRRFGRFAPLTVALMGDLRFGRTTHSLAWALAQLHVHIICVAPQALQLPIHLQRQLQSHTTLQMCDTLQDVIHELDVLYVTRIQTERMVVNQTAVAVPEYPISLATLRTAKSELLILHPLPRAGEIQYEVDADPRAWYFEQVANGVLVRMALLDRVLGGVPIQPLGEHPMVQSYMDPPWAAQKPAGPPCSNSRCITHFERDILPRWDPASDPAVPQYCVYCDSVRPT